MIKAETRVKYPMEILQAYESYVATLEKPVFNITTGVGKPIIQTELRHFFKKSLTASAVMVNILTINCQFLY